MLVSCWFFVFNFLLSLALRFYCFLSLCFDSNVFYSLGCDYASILLLFYLWDVIILRFYCFLSLGCDYPLILLFFYLLDVIILRCKLFFYCNFVSFFHSFHWIFHFFQLFSSFLFFDGSPIDNLYINNHILVINFIITEPVSVGSVPNSAPNRLLEPVLSVQLALTRSGSLNRSRTDRVVPIPTNSPCIKKFYCGCLCLSW